VVGGVRRFRVAPSHFSPGRPRAGAAEHEPIHRDPCRRSSIGRRHRRAEGAWRRAAHPRRGSSLLYDEWLESQPGWQPDVVPPANGRDVQALISLRGEEWIVHATTPWDWTAELHRHLDRGGCIVDCLPERPGSARFVCSTAAVTPVDGVANDAAMPFLSAAAGLMLVQALALFSHAEPQRAGPSGPVQPAWQSRSRRTDAGRHPERHAGSVDT
jgi:hypothetical protein